MNDKFVEMALLYDFYGKILTDRQREIVDLYYMKDYSLGEIGELLKISRQAVHDNLKRAEKQLEGMEERLELIKRFQIDRQERSQIVKRLDEVIKVIDTENSNHGAVKELREIREYIRLAMGG